MPLGIRVGAGQSHFPSPAQDYEQHLDLGAQLITNPPATFIFEVIGDSMIGAGIYPGSKVLVDRSISPRHGHIVVVDIDGEWIIKRLHYQNSMISLVSENPHHPPIRITEGQEVFIFGVVTYDITKHI